MTTAAAGCAGPPPGAPGLSGHGSAAARAWAPSPAPVGTVAAQRWGYGVELGEGGGPALVLTESRERTQIHVPWTQRDLRVQPGNTLAWATLPGASGHAGVCGRGGAATPRPQPPLRKAPPPRVHEPPAALYPPLLLAPPLLLPEGPTPASRGRPALSRIRRMRVHSPPKTSACQHRAKEPRKSGPGSEAVMPTQLWVRAPVPGPRMVCHPVRGPGVGGSLPSAGSGARLESQEQGRAGGPLGTEPCPELRQLTAVPSPLKTHTHMADPLPENPALNASAVSSAPRG